MNSVISKAPKVSVCMITYNHANYVSQAIEGVLMQQANFSIELVIGDDCSTDNTRAICIEYQNKYPEIVKLRLPKNNLGMYRNFAKNLLYCKGDYIAICEGDDYWTDPFKLQKQVDFLEQNSTASICWTRFIELDTEGNLYNPLSEAYFSDGNVRRVTINNMFNPYLTWTLTAAFRRKVLEKLNILDFKYFKDNSLYALALSKGDGYILNDFTAVYRLHKGGVFSSLNKASQTFQNYLTTVEIYKLITSSKNKNIKDVIFSDIMRAYALEKSSRNNKVLFSSKLLRKMVYSAPVSVKFKLLKWILVRIKFKLL